MLSDYFFFKFRLINCNEIILYMVNNATVVLWKPVLISVLNNVHVSGTGVSDRVSDCCLPLE